ncbi:hypothetical protein LguiA_012798 [Lonicera macranthoides]
MEVEKSSSPSHSMVKKGVGLKADAETAPRRRLPILHRLLIIKEIKVLPKKAEKSAAPRPAPPLESAAAERGMLFDNPKDAPAETIVSVYRINDLSTSDRWNFQNRSLVLIFAIFDYKLAGCMVSLPDGFTVVVVGGERKPIEKYRNLMLKHLKWTAVKSSQNAEGEEKEEENEIKKCVLLWEGRVAKPSFNKFTIHQCETEAEARKVFYDAGVTDYWDLAVNYSQ